MNIGTYKKGGEGGRGWKEGIEEGSCGIRDLSITDPQFW